MDNWYKGKKSYLTQLWQSGGKYSDLTITVAEGQSFKVHKSVMAESPVFYEAIDKLQEDSATLDFPEIQGEIMQSFLNFIYTGELGDGFQASIELFEVTSKFEFPVLVELCEESLGKQLYVENCLKIFQSAMNTGNKTLIRKSLDFVCKNGEKALEIEDFANLKLDSVLEIIKQDDLCVSNELQIFQAVCRWGTAECDRLKVDSSDPQQFRTVLDKLLKWIRFPLLSHEQFKEHVRPKRLLGVDELCNLVEILMVPEEEKKNLAEGLFITTQRKSMKKSASENKTVTVLQTATTVEPSLPYSSISRIEYVYPPSNTVSSPTMHSVQHNTPFYGHHRYQSNPINTFGFR